MYTTCVIWLAFVPLYFGTANHVPLRLTSMSVTISLSASVTVICLFSPKVRSFDMDISFWFFSASHPSPSPLPRAHRPVVVHYSNRARTHTSYYYYSLCIVEL